MGITRREDCKIPLCTKECECWRTFEQKDGYRTLSCEILRQYKVVKDPPTPASYEKKAA